MATSLEYSNQLLDSIDLIVKDALVAAQYDKTIKATIVKCENSFIGKYLLKYQELTFFAYDYNNRSFRGGMSVYVLIPGNDMSQTKIIIGPSSENEIITLKELS